MTYIGSTIFVKHDDFSKYLDQSSAIVYLYHKLVLDEY